MLLVATMPLLLAQPAIAAPPPESSVVVHLAELQIDPAHLEEYKALLREEIAASIRIEPGVLTLDAVAVKDHPNQLRIFEIYRDQAAYQAHLRSPHFLRYKAATQQMVQSLHLLETEPVILGQR
ncbi:MAG: antibiotic biosynthesis monooxygenase [Acidobacteriota bacterium]|nr:antibiotic biosynthesis monooxygenase [Acidobacteriota bacterium]